MEKLTKLMVSGATVAAIIISAGALNTHRLESRLRDLESACIQEERRSITEAAKEGLGFQPDPSNCDAESLVRLKGPDLPKGVQAEIVSVQRAIGDSSGWPYILAGLIFVLTGLPWAWYFLLRRIRELRDAILGK